MNQKKRISRGDYGYLNQRRVRSFLKCAAGFALVLALVLCGRVLFRAHGRLFLLMAVIAAVPAAISAVSLIMSLRFGTGRKEVFDLLEGLRGETPVFYDSVITADGEPFGVNCFLPIGKHLLGYTEYENNDVAVLERSLRNLAAKNGFRDWTIEIFTDFTVFTERVTELKEKTPVPGEEDAGILDLIKALSL